jgi:hypothetical protein
MKKLFLLVFLPLVLTGCSFGATSVPTSSNTTTDNNEKVVVNQEEVENTQLSTDSKETKECVVPYFKFPYPANWIDCSFSAIGETTFKVDEQTNLSLSLTRIIKDRYDELKTGATGVSLSTSSTGEFFEVAKEGVFLFGVLDLDGIYYEAVFKAPDSVVRASVVNIIRGTVGTLDRLDGSPQYK